MVTTQNLIANGYFREEIPPVFTSWSLANACGDLLPRVYDLHPKKELPNTWPEQYNAADYGLRRRDMRIPNPANQMIVAEMISQKWEDILRCYGNSSISRSKDKISERWSGEGRPSVRMLDKALMKQQRLLALYGHRYVLRTDISRFFPSIYTHSIAWALHGKDAIKKDSNAQTQKPKPQKLWSDGAFWGADLDRAVRNCNGRHTAGIPIGPGTSHIIAETIMSAIDKQIQDNLGARLKDGFRYVDDYFLCFDTYTDAEAALTEIQKAAGEYELAVNDRKTEILPSVAHIEELWPHQLRAVGVRSNENTTRERESLTQFASEAFALARTYHNESVMKYVLRILRRLPLPPAGRGLNADNWDLYESILIRIMTAYPYTADMVASILHDCHKAGFPLNMDKLSNVVSSFIVQHAPLEHHSEVAWALWLTKMFRLRISSDDMGKVLPAVQSSVCALLAIDCVESRLIKPMDPEPWEKRLKEEELTGRYWLLAYEAPMHDWLGSDTTHIENCGFFSKLLENNVSFYDEEPDEFDFEDLDSWY